MSSQHPSDQDRRLLATAVFRLFDHWQLAEADQLALLGMKAEQLAVLREMRDSGVLTASAELLERVRALLKIYRYLSMLYPERSELAKKWMTSRNMRLEGHSPMQRIQAGGTAGIRAVTVLLEEQLF